VKGPAFGEEVEGGEGGMKKIREKKRQTPNP